LFVVVEILGWGHTARLRSVHTVKYDRYQSAG
jgi:hypothetical protein